MKRNILTLVLAIVSSVWMMSEAQINSLCDTWNVLEIYGDLGPEEEIWRTTHYTMGGPKTINDKVYYTVSKDGAYAGALREAGNGRIYIYPSNGWQQEFLIYDFNAQVGDTLKDLYIGNRYFEYGPKILYATVKEIKPTTPRTFMLDVVYIFPGIEDAELVHWEIEWVEGVGLTDGPIGNVCPLDCEGGPGMKLLCAYKNGKQIYTSEAGEKYGCEYNGDPVEPQTTDTIPLYIRDDSGTSTVDPVDPNQIYATLMGNVLTVHNNTGAQVTFTVNNISVKNVAARVRTNVEPVSFTESISVELSEDGIYEILLTSEEWNYTVFGTVNYIRSGTEITKEETSSTSKKVLRGTQILIEREGKTYTLTGQEVK